MAISRRAALGLGAVALGGGALAAAGVENGTLPGRSEWYRRLGLNGPDGVVPSDEPGPVVRDSFFSRQRDQETGFVVGDPPGSAPGSGAALPVVVALHMLGSDAPGLFSRSLGIDRFLAAAVASGVPPFAVAAADGGTSYWHRRPSGEDAGAMVIEEFLPLLADRGLAIDRIGMLGWSMGGYGALRLAGLLGPQRVTAVAAASPALWTDPADASASGFDSPAEYRDYTVFGRERELTGIAVRIDCGQGDPFYAAVREYADGLSASAAAAGGTSGSASGGASGSASGSAAGSAAGSQSGSAAGSAAGSQSGSAAGSQRIAEFPRGGHDRGFWRRILPDQLAFLGTHLRRT